MPVENMILSLFYLQSGLHFEFLHGRTALDNYKLKDFIHHLSELKYLIFPNEIFQPEAVTATVKLSMKTQLKMLKASKSKTMNVKMKSYETQQDLADNVI